MKVGISKLALLAAMAGVVAPAAFAQTASDNPFLRGRYVAVSERNQPQFDPTPLHAGSFNVSSNLGIFGEFNDNVYAEDKSVSPTEDTTIRIAPTVDIASIWSVHELTAGLSVDHAEHLNEDSETTTNYNGYVGGRLDVVRNFALRGRLTGAKITEPRWSPTAQGPNPVQYDRYGAEVGATWRGGRYLLDGALGQREESFDDTASQGYRDMNETYVSGRASYAISPDVAVFVQGTQSEFDYNLNVPFNRDSTRRNAQVGASFELASPFRGDFAVGYVEEDKSDPTRADFDGLSVNGRVQWFPTQLTTLTFQAERSVFDPGLFNAATASYTRYGVRADHELLRNVVLYGEVFASTNDYQDYDRKDDVVDVGLGATYKLNQRMRFEAGYRFHTQDSSGAFADRNIDQNVLSVGLRLFP